MACCRFVGKGLIGAMAGAGVLALLFGTAAPSYVKTAVHRFRQNAKNHVPISFDIERVRQQIADLEPAIHVNRENIASAEVDVERLDREILATRANLAQEKKEIVALRDRLDSGNLQLVSGVAYTPEEIKGELDRRFHHYQQVKQILKEREDTLKARHKAVVSARKQLAEMVSSREALLTKVEEIEARMKQIEATQAANQFSFDDSELSRVKQSVSDLEKRIEVMARVAEQEGRLADKGIPIEVEPSHADVLKQIDAEFGATSASETASVNRGS